MIGAGWILSAIWFIVEWPRPYSKGMWWRQWGWWLIVFLSVWLWACDDTRTITETEYVDRDVIVTEPYYTRTVYDENMGEFTAEQQDELRTKGYITMRLFYSPRNAGRIWVRAGTPSFGTSDIYDVTCGEKFVAVGASGKIGYSPDGDTWTQAETPSFGTSGVSRVVSCNNIYMAMSAGVFKTATSPDGNTWTQQVHKIKDVYTLTTDGARFIAIGTRTGGSDLDFLHTTDGVTWTTLSKVLPSYMLALQYGNSRYFLLEGETSCYSDNMSDWTSVGTGLTESSVGVYKYGNGYHVALFMIGGVYKVYYSIDFEDWSYVMTVQPSSRLHFANGRFFITTPSEMYVSTNGAAWSSTELPFNDTPPYNNVMSMCGGNGRIVAVGVTGQIAFSLE